MNWLHKLVQSKQSRVAPMHVKNLEGQAVWTPRRFDQMAEEGYQKNPIVYRAVTLISRGVGSVKWNLSHRGQIIEKHPLAQLLQHPNPMQGFPRFMEGLTAYLLLAGNAYIEAVGAQETGQPLELHLLRPDRVKIIPGADGLPAAYTYTVEGNTRRIPAHTPQGMQTILHAKMFHPLNDWYGMSPMEAAATAIDQHSTVSAHNLALLKNGARPTGALICKGDRSEHSMRQLSDSLSESFNLTSRTGKPMLLHGEWEWQELGVKPKDLDYVEGKYLSAREIAQAYGVPSMLVGVPGDATFANYREARYHLWEDTILPLMETLKMDLNNWLLPMYKADGRGLQLEYDTESIPALTPKREAAWAKIAEADFLTLNEKRSAVGYPEHPNGDELVTSRSDNRP